MKQIFACICLFLAACSGPEQREKDAQAASRDSLRQVNDHESDYVNLPDTIGCEDLNDTAALLALAAEIPEVHLSDILKNDISAVKGHFTSVKNEEMLIRYRAYLNGSCGSCCSLMLIVSCEEKPVQILYSGYCGDFSAQDVRDYNADGLLDLSWTCGHTWSGELGEWFVVKTYPGGKEKTLYESFTSNYMHGSYGGDDDWKRYANGDTVSRFYYDTLIDPDRDGIFQVMERREFNLYRGGKSEAEIEKKQETRRDTVIRELEG